jgi:hypothetical protein
VAILDDLRMCLESQRYRISGHAADEMLADALEEAEVLRATSSGEVIEDYPEAFPFPACLVLGRTAENTPIHAVWAVDPATCYAALVTVYRPDPARWTADFRTQARR